MTHIAIVLSAAALMIWAVGSAASHQRIEPRPARGQAFHVQQEPT